MKVYPCPLCGRWRDRRGTPFTEEERTMRHITGAHDSAHRDERGEDYWGKIDPTDVIEQGEPADGGGEPARSAILSGVSVDPDRDPVPLIEAVEENSARVRELQRLAEENERLRERVDELAETLEAVRADVAGLYAAHATDVKGRHIALSATEERGWLPESVDPHDPTGEFEND
jgi:hypothetical protein